MTGERRAPGRTGAATSTIEDVARRAGVSTATVSRAIRGLPHVSPETRTAVLAAAKSLGYVPSAPAVSLASGRTRTVTLACPSITRWFFAELIEGIELALRTAGFDVLLHTLPTLDIPPRQRFEPEVLRGRIDAAVVCGLSLDKDEAEGLRALGCPTVFVSVAQPGFACILIDDVAAARAATRHLIDLGHRRIAHLGGSAAFAEPWSPLVARRQGWLAELAAAGIHVPEEYYIEGDFTAIGARDQAREFLREHPEVTAIVADSDEMAIGVMRAALEAGLAVPGELSVVGFDGHDLSELFDLTTVAQPVRYTGSLAAGQLLAALDAADPTPPTSQVVPCELLVRGTTGPPPER